MVKYGCPNCKEIDYIEAYGYVGVADQGRFNEFGEWEDIDTYDESVDNPFELNWDDYDHSYYFCRGCGNEFKRAAKIKINEPNS